MITAAHVKVLRRMPTRPGEAGWTTATALSLLLHQPRGTTLSRLNDLHKAGMADKERGRPVRGEDLNRYRIASKGLVLLRDGARPPEQRSESVNRIAVRDRHMERPDRTRVPRLGVGDGTVTIEEYRAWEEKAGDRMTKTTLSQPLGRASQGYKRKASKSRTRRAS